MLNNISKLAVAMLMATSFHALAESMPDMQGGSAPPDARDPHAYSGGQDFGPLGRPHMGDEMMSGFWMNRLERVQTNNETYSNAYELRGWVGGNYDKLVLKAEGDVDEGKLHEGRTELFWSHATSAYWDVQLGMRNDSGVLPSQNWLAFGVQGLAPYWFEVDATLYAGNEGRTAMRLSAEYELLFTQKMILQPRFEANLYGKADAEREIGAGLGNALVGLRLRYEIRREFAPYIGIDWLSKYGETADMATAAGASVHDTNVVAGLRAWF